MFTKTATLLIVLKTIVLIESRQVLQIAQKPSTCTKNYCFEKSDVYPQKLIDTFASQLVSVDIGDVSTLPASGTPFNDECRKKVYYQPIYEIVDRNDTERYVIQSGDIQGFQQIFRMEECEHEGLITKVTQHLNPKSKSLSHYKLRCEQSYIDYPFLVLSKDGTRTEYVKAKGGIPVCCKCTVGDVY